MKYEFIIYVFALIGVFMTAVVLLNVTEEMRYNLKIKYLLRPRYKKGDYVLVPGRNGNPTLAYIKHVFTDWGKKEISYEVKPVLFGNEYVDLDYFEQLNFDEKMVYSVKNYYDIETWRRNINSYKR